ncbi:nitrate/nitrite transporter [Quadrisphaera sp. DSM 44207]|uniref:MFS transporter n=1 Tax=Quadrisphaera sp. DSM 44207 TaxID=1881057 RepID=UPI00088B6F63|nr:MFS transporter [Quadrisphaera sp. DSM 44207]SDQ89284.1 Nitrate/nitrite transporter NarK [Quadrisphaera sp. DSM 44207]
MRVRGAWRAWAVWGAGVAAYVVAVLQRTSFGVAGLEAAERFDAGASALSAFTVLQLLVYAGLQVPAGLALDRFGSRRLVTTGALVMALGQLVLALGETVPVAVLGRVLVGAGDALTFVSVLRLVPAWFPPARAPIVTQMTGLVGQAGQVLSAVPLVALLGAAGWTAAFGAAAALGVVAAALAWAVLRDAPGVPLLTGPPLSWQRVGEDLARSWLHPGTRLGLWSHFSTQFPGTVFALMWGFPFLVSAQGLPPARASALVTLFVLAGLVCGPFLGVLVQRHPLRRSWLVLTIVAVNATAWTAVLAWPGRAPLWLLVVLVLALATGGPGSMVGFDFARTFNPQVRLGTATGIVNIGGFAASLVVVLAVGIVLDLTADGPGGAYALADFRLALAVQYPVWAVGVVGILVTRRLVRRRMAAEGVVVPPVREVLARLRQERRAARASRR